MEVLLTHARSAGALPVGGFRTVVLETNGRISVRDFEDLDAARRYADDAATEEGATPPIAIVVDDRFEIVHRGRPYGSGG